MIATFPSTCPCGLPIEPGEEIRPLDTDEGTRWVCSGCNFTGKRRIVARVEPAKSGAKLSQSIKAREKKRRKDA